MSLYKDIANAVRGVHSFVFAEDVIITEPGKAAYTTKATLGKTKIEERVSGNEKQRVAVRSCRFVSVETLRDDAIVDADGDRWVIDDTLDRSASGLTVTLKRITVREVARPNYRGRG